jgi:hypothetical protein
MEDLRGRGGEGGGMDVACNRQLGLLSATRKLHPKLPALHCRELRLLVETSWFLKMLIRGYLLVFCISLCLILVYLFGLRVYLHRSVTT